MKVLALILFFSKNCIWVIVSGHSFQQFYLHTAPHLLNINVYVTEALLIIYKALLRCWLRSVTGKCDLKNDCVHYENISLRIRNRVLVWGNSFWIFQWNISFVPYPHGTIFSYFYEAFYTFGSITPFDSDLAQKLVQGVCYKTSCSYFYSFLDHAVPFLLQLFFKIFVFAGFIFMA